MKVKNKLFVFALILSLILSASAVVAQDNISFDQSELKTVSIETDDDNIELEDDDNDDAVSNDFAEADYAFKDIQDKIDVSSSTEVIFLNGKTYVYSGSEISIRNKDLTIIGGSDLEDGGYATLDAKKASRIMSVTSSKLVIMNVKFVNGNASDNGGAINLNGGKLILSNCIFENNEGNYGGALNSNDLTEIFDCNFTGNTARNQGGAIRFSGSTLNSYIENSNFISNNAAVWGGAIQTEHQNMTIRDSNFTANSVNNLYGAAINNDGNDLTVYHCIFAGNFANSNYAGSIRSVRKITIDNSTFINNSAISGGGALYFEENAGGSIIFHSKFYNNSAGDKGGAIFSTVSVTIEDNFFKANQAGIGDNIVVISKDSKVTNNEIDNSNINYSGIYVGNPDNVIVNDNTFSNPDCEIEYAIISLENTFIGIPGQSIQIPVKVFTNTGKAMRGYVFSNGYFRQYLENGTATFNITLPSQESKLDLVFYCDGAEANTTVFAVNNLIESISQSDDSDDVTIKVSKLIPGKAIININGKNYMSQAVEGEVVFKLTDLYNGIYPAIVAYVADEIDYDQSQLAVIYIKHNPKYEIVQNMDVNVDYSAKATYRVLITKDGKTAGAGENVTITFNGKNHNVMTDENGYASLAIDSNVKIGNYVIKATCNGVSVSNKVNVRQIIKASDKKVKKSVKVTKVKISLNKVDGKILKSAVLKVKFNGKTYNVKTDKKGVAIWKVKKAMLKKLKVGKKVKYTVTYGKDTLTKMITIKK